MEHILQRLIRTRIDGFMDSWIHGLMDSWIHGFMDLWIYGCKEDLLS